MSQTNPQLWLNKTLLADCLAGHGPNPVKVGGVIKAGGEGTVFHDLQRPEYVLKIMHTPSQASEAKVRGMLASPPKHQLAHHQGNQFVQIAWPQEILTDSNGLYVGFSMRYADLSQWISTDAWTNPRERRLNHLEKDDRVRIHLAANIAAVTEFINNAGHALIDLKPLNVMADRQNGYVCLIDCDGFRISANGLLFPAGAFTPNYLAPEFQVNGVGPSKCGEEQDRFALAVVIYELLDNGIQPFSGVDLLRPTEPIEIPPRIKQRRTFLTPGSGLEPHRRSHHTFFRDETLDLFVRAFVGPPDQRPSSSDWRAHLFDLAQHRMEPCSLDPNHWGFGKGCPWCFGPAIQMGPPKVVSSPPQSSTGTAARTSLPSRPRTKKNTFPNTQPHPGSRGGGTTGSSISTTTSRGSVSATNNAQSPLFVGLMFRFWKPAAAIMAVLVSGGVFALARTTHEMHMRNDRYLSLVNNARQLGTEIESPRVSSAVRPNFQGLERGIQVSLGTAHQALERKDFASTDASLSAADLTIQSLQGLLNALPPPVPPPPVPPPPVPPPPSHHQTHRDVADNTQPDDTQKINFPVQPQPPVEQPADTFTKANLTPTKTPVVPIPAVSPIVRTRLQDLQNRAAVINQALQPIEAAQAANGYGLRGDMAGAKIRMNSGLKEASKDISSGSEPSAEQTLDATEKAVEQLEHFLNISG